MARRASQRAAKPFSVPDGFVPAGFRRRRRPDHRANPRDHVDRAPPGAVRKPPRWGGGARDTLRVTPERALVREADLEIGVSVRSLQKGDTVVVRGGDRIPVDGQALEGTAAVDEAHITGRSFPRACQPGDRVYAGTAVQSGRLLIRAGKLGRDTYLSRIALLVEESLSTRTQSEKRR